MDMLRRAAGVWLLALLCATATSFPLGAQAASQENGRPVALVLQIDSNVPVIDGNLDEGVWARAQPVTDFFQREPVEGEPVSERTEVRFIADGEALYVGAWLYDRTPDQIVVGERVRDANLETGDYFGIILDTYRDRQNGFIFSTTPASIEYDGQVVREGQGGGVFQRGQTRQQAGAAGGFNVNWDGSWEVATSQDGQGWYAEFRIPFSTLRYAGGSVQTWGMNLVRRIRRRNEESFWAPVPRQYNLMRLSMAGDLVGIPVPVQRSATVSPYVLGSAQRDYVNAPGDTDYPREIGVDAKVTLTSLTLDLTTNTDFAQVEVDEQRTNLTRFPLFFPEKRPFFLENAGTFTAGTPQAVDLFFSRKIGISSGGNPVPILGGGRLSGKVAGLGVGVLQIFTDNLDADVEAGVHENSFTVARVTKEVGGRSRAGAMFVQRRATHDGSDFNRTYAVDGRVGLGDKWTFDTWVAKTETPGLTGRDVGWSQYGQYRTRDWEIYARYIQVGEDFNPEVGFIDRKGYRHVTAQVQRYIRSSIPWVREFTPHITYRAYWDFAGFEETSFIHIDTEAHFENGGRFGPEINIHGEGLKEPFEIAPGVVIPAGNYDFVQNVWDLGTNPSVPFSILARFEVGGFYSGHQTGGNATITYRRSSALTASVSLNHNIVRLDEGDFETTLLGVRFGYFFTPRVFLQSLIQYSDQADIWSANVRFGVLDTAGTGLYVVYNEAQESRGLTSLVTPQSRSFIVKYSRQLRLF